MAVESVCVWPQEFDEQLRAAREECEREQLDRRSVQQQLEELRSQYQLRIHSLDSEAGTVDDRIHRALRPVHIADCWLLRVLTAHFTRPPLPFVWCACDACAQSTPHSKSLNYVRALGLYVCALVAPVLSLHCTLQPIPFIATYLHALRLLLAFVAVTDALSPLHSTPLHSRCRAPGN